MPFCWFCHKAAHLFKQCRSSLLRSQKRNGRLIWVSVGLLISIPLPSICMSKVYPGFFNKWGQVPRYEAQCLQSTVFSMYNVHVHQSIWAKPWENMSYAICEQQRRRSACAPAQSDQRLCCSLSRQNDTSSLYMRNFKILAGLCSWTGQFVSCLVGDSRRHIFSWRGSYAYIFNAFQLSSRIHVFFCPIPEGWDILRLLLAQAQSKQMYPRFKKSLFCCNINDSR